MGYLDEPSWYRALQGTRRVEVREVTCPFSYELLLDIAREAGISSDVVLGDISDLSGVEIERRLDDMLTAMLVAYRKQRQEGDT